jgi:hypothetical protein
VAFDLSIGLLLGEEPATSFDSLLSIVQNALSLHGYPPHKEPRSWAEVFARYPGKKPRPRVLSERLGFYGEEKYSRLASLAQHTALHGRPPLSWDSLSLLAPSADNPEKLAGASSADSPGAAPAPSSLRRFAHLQAALSMGAVVLPQEIDPVIVLPRNPESLHVLLSAPRLREESEILAYLLGGFDSGSWREEWQNEERAARCTQDGLQKESPEAPEMTWGAELGLCRRLQRAAAAILWSGALGLTN